MTKKFSELKELKEFTAVQLARLKKEYEPMRGKTISVTNANKLGALFTRFDSNKNALEKLYGADIPFISTMAMTRLMTGRHDDDGGGDGDDDADDDADRHHNLSSLDWTAPRRS